MALLVTTWSNLGALPCGPVPERQGDAPGAHDHSHTAHADHSSPVDGQRVDPPLDDAAPECGILMACGAVLSGAATAPVEGSSRTDEAPLASIGEPSAVDLTQDPPPPRRIA